MPKLVDKKGSASETMVAGNLPGIEGDSRELERVVANSATVPEASLPFVISL